MSSCIKKKIKSLKGAADSLVAQSCRPNLVRRSHPDTQRIQGSACRDLFARSWHVLSLIHSSRSLCHWQRASTALQGVCARDLPAADRCVPGDHRLGMVWPVVATLDRRCWVCTAQLPATEPFIKKVAPVCAPLLCIFVVYR